MNDDFLTQFKKSPRPEFVSALYERINGPTRTKRNTFRRSMRVSFALSLILLLILGLSPTIRTYAWQGIIQLGRILFSDEPTYAEQFEIKINSDTLTPTAEPDHTTIEWQAPPLLTLKEASRQAGFQVVQINNLPEDLKMITRFVTISDSENSFTKVTTSYQSSEYVLVLNQTLYEPEASQRVLPVGDATITDVTVQNSEGVWINALRLSTYVNGQNKVAPQFASVLVWEKDNFEFWLQSTPSLPLESMLEIAESIR